MGDNKINSGEKETVKIDDKNYPVARTIKVINNIINNIIDNFKEQMTLLKHANYYTSFFSNNDDRNNCIFNFAALKTMIKDKIIKTEGIDTYLQSKPNIIGSFIHLQDKKLYFVELYVNEEDTLSLSIGEILGAKTHGYRYYWNELHKYDIKFLERDLKSNENLKMCYIVGEVKTCIFKNTHSKKEDSQKIIGTSIETQK